MPSGGTFRSNRPWGGGRHSAPQFLCRTRCSPAARSARSIRSGVLMARWGERGGCAVARLPHGAIRALATVSGANDRPLSHLRCPSYTVVGQLSGVGHEVATRCRATTLVAGRRCIGQNGCTAWRRPAEFGGDPNRRPGQRSRPMMTARSTGVGFGESRSSGSMDLSRWLGHEPWRMATMSSPRVHEKRMAEIHVSEGARGQLDGTPGRGRNNLLAQHP